MVDLILFVLAFEMSGSSVPFWINKEKFQGTVRLTHVNLSSWKKSSMFYVCVLVCIEWGDGSPSAKATVNQA